MIKISKIGGVKDFRVSDRLIYRVDKALWFLAGECQSKAELLIEKVADYNYKVSENFLYYQVEDGSSLMRLDLKAGGEEELKGEYYRTDSFLESEGKILTIGIYSGNDVVCLINKDNFSLVLVRPFKGLKRILSSNGIVFSKRFGSCHGFCLVDYDLQTLRWEYVLEEGERVIGQMHVWDGVLVVPTRTGQLSYVKTYQTGIDLKNGRKIWKQETLPDFSLDGYSGELHGLGDDYVVMNPLQGEIFRKPFPQIREISKSWVVAHYCGLYEGGLYFVTTTHPDAPVHFGRIDIATQKLDFIQPLDVDLGVGVACAPVYRDGRLYILDAKNVLHIYAEE